MNNFSSGWNKRTNQRLEVPSTEASIIDAVCINCNKRFKSMRAVSMHLRMTAARHALNFISYGKYDKKTGIKEINRPYLSLMNDNKELPKILDQSMMLEDGESHSLTAIANRVKGNQKIMDT
jgi:hypothetical protein